MVCHQRGFFMVLQIACLRECLATLWTAEWFVNSVDFFMGLQIACLRECLATLRTAEWVFFGVCDGIFKGVIKLLRAKINQLLERSSKMGYRARIPASIAMTLQKKKWGNWEGNCIGTGGAIFKINCDQFRLLFAFAVNWVERNYGLKDHLTLRLLLYFYRKNRLSAVALLQK